MPGSKMLSRGYTTFVALLCTAAVAFAIHANGEAAKAGRAAERAQMWERYARATRAHRRRTAKSYGKLVRQYNALARTANARQKRLLASLSRARRHAATASPGAAAQPVTYETTQAIAIAPPPAAPAAAAAAAAPSQPTTKTS